MSGLLLEFDVETIRARLIGRKRIIRERILEGLRGVVEAGIMPNGLKMFLFGSRAVPMAAEAGSDVDVLLLGELTISQRDLIENAIREALPEFGLDLLHVSSETALSVVGRRIIAEGIEITK